MEHGAMNIKNISDSYIRMDLLHIESEWEMPMALGKGSYVY
jgi:hypothetical protein